MNPVWQEIGIVVLGNVCTVLTTMYLIRWKKRLNRPRELEVAIDDLQADVVKLRISYAKMRTLLNGHGWKIPVGDD